MTTIDPVIDPTSDYDIFDPQYLLDPFPTIEQIRQSSCPVAHTERWGGSWMPAQPESRIARCPLMRTASSNRLVNACGLCPVMLPKPM